MKYVPPFLLLVLLSIVFYFMLEDRKERNVKLDTINKSLVYVDSFSLHYNLYTEANKKFNSNPRTRAEIDSNNVVLQVCEYHLQKQTYFLNKQIELTKTK